MVVQRFGIGKQGGHTVSTRYVSSGVKSRCGVVGTYWSNCWKMQSRCHDIEVVVR